MFGKSKSKKVEFSERDYEEEPLEEEVEEEDYEEDEPPIVRRSLPSLPTKKQSTPKEYNEVVKNKVEEVEEESKSLNPESTTPTKEEIYVMGMYHLERAYYFLNLLK